MTTTTLPAVEIPVGDKKIYGIPGEPGKYCFLVDCYVLEGVVEVVVTNEQAAELIDHMENRSHGRPIQEIIPEVDKRLREIFISGITPAEWEEMFGRISEEEAEDDDERDFVSDEDDYYEYEEGEGDCISDDNWANGTLDPNT